MYSPSRTETQMYAMKPPSQMTRTASSSSPHPRRPPAHRSVSLLHPSRANVSPPDRSDSSSDSNPLVTRQRGKEVRDAGRAAEIKETGSNSSPSSLLPLGRDSSGESSNAEKWFEKSDNNVRNNSATFADNDPPFFMRNSSSSNTPPELLRQMRSFDQPLSGSTSLPLRTGLLQLGTDGSSTEDFRSVIDDLTVENKKLKRRLKKYERLHDSHLRDEKLFEVRIHGLPSEKKRELEETLRKFTASLGSGFHPNGYDGLIPVLNGHHKAGSSQTSLQNDSAYASMSTSGPGSSGVSGSDTANRSRLPTAAARRQNIHSYLHHIPEAMLLHSNPATMSERQKKKLVVRRLEQIFAGTRATAGIHQHPIQQQEISHLAARENRSAGEALGQRLRQEGLREAHIMPHEVEDSSTDPSSKQDGNNTPPENESGRQLSHPAQLQPSESLQSDQGVIEQRPTRPMDIDPHRAQVPSENMRYIRHLGFSPPDVDRGDHAEEGHGWIYLNLLINMAQLHTINVTADFVRKALSDYQSNLELSPDGRKVRWRGRPALKPESSSGEGSLNDTAVVDIPHGQSPRKRPRLTTRESSRRQKPSLPHAQSSSSRTENKLVYTPLFFHKSSTESDSSSSEEEEEEDDSMASSFPIAPAGDSSGMTSSGMRTTSTKKNKRLEDGPIIFYNNARFCTDLSGDYRPTGNVNTPPYTHISAQPIGKSPTRSSDSGSEMRGPLASAFELPEPMDLSDNPIPESMELSFPPQASTRSTEEALARPFHMEVSGIGGVWPADHFAIKVESRRAMVSEEEAPEHHQAATKSVPQKFEELLRGASAKRKARTPVLEEEIVSTSKQDLRPSTLPPALGYIGFDSSLGDDESEDDEEMSISPESPVAFPPSAAPQPVDLHYTSSDEEDDEDDVNDDESSGSLDLLATAREADPEAIRQKEREYDANMAERLAEEIPAGSSAATAGGGSGYASPASGMRQEEYHRALKEARGRGEAFSRAKTSDSMLVAQNSSDEDEEDEEMSDIGS